MSNTDTIHIYYHHDQRLVASFLRQGMVVEELSVMSDKSDGLLESFLRRNAQEIAHLFVFIHSTHVVFAEASVPVVFNEDDILQYIHIEQAKLFPMLEEEIYFDFSVPNIDEENKNLVVAACNVKKFSKLELVLKALKINWVKLGIFQEDLQNHEGRNVNNFNLLPWRQLEKKRAAKAQLKIFGSVALMTAVIMLIASIFFIKIDRHDKERQILFFTQEKENLLKFAALKSVNKNLSTLAERWKDQVEIAHDQAHLVNLLMMVESQRPDNLVLDAITWSKNGLLLKGRVKKAMMIKVYLDNLHQHAVEGEIKFIGNSADKKFPIQFEIKTVSESI
ncbi:MAG: hypothetical protein KBD83_04310 [Gammaproteobacteria bacterium]|nr:hypothetical protein [Gammaproteobacteria bacterium]